MLKVCVEGDLHLLAHQIWAQVSKIDKFAASLFNRVAFKVEIETIIASALFIGKQNNLKSVEYLQKVKYWL